MHILIIDSEQSGERMVRTLEQALPEDHWEHAGTEEAAFRVLFGRETNRRQYHYVLINWGSTLTYTQMNSDHGVVWFAKGTQELQKIPVLAYDPHEDLAAQKIQLLRNLPHEVCSGAIDIRNLIPEVCWQIGRIVPREHLSSFPERVPVGEPPLSFRADLQPPSDEVRQRIEAWKAAWEAGKR